MLKRAPSVFGLVVVALAGLALAFYGGLLAGNRPPATQTVTPTASPPSSGIIRPSPTATLEPIDPPTPRLSPTPLDTSVRAGAVVVPQRSAELAMSLTGLVASLFVREGDAVTTGQLLLRLDQSGYVAEVDEAEASLRRAEAAAERAAAQLEHLPDDATPGQIEIAQTDLRLAQADIDLAEATLTEAQTALRQTELRSPIAGTVAAIAISSGELAFAGTTVITVADMSSWLIETTDVSELEVVRIAVGDTVDVTFAALPDLVLTGLVDRIQVRGTTESGQVQFAVVIRPDEHLARLRWNMSAQVRIEPSG